MEGKRRVCESAVLMAQLMSPQDANPAGRKENVRRPGISDRVGVRPAGKGERFLSGQ